MGHFFSYLLLISLIYCFCSTNYSHLYSLCATIWKLYKCFFSLLGIILLNTVHKLHVWAFSILSQLAIYQDLAFSIVQLSLMIFLREKYMWAFLNNMVIWEAFSMKTILSLYHLFPKLLHSNICNCTIDF